MNATVWKNSAFLFGEFEFIHANTLTYSSQK